MSRVQSTSSRLRPWHSKTLSCFVSRGHERYCPYFSILPFSGLRYWFLICSWESGCTSYQYPLPVQPQILIFDMLIGVGMCVISVSSACATSDTDFGCAHGRRDARHISICFLTAQGYWKWHIFHVLKPSQYQYFPLTPLQILKSLVKFPLYSNITIDNDAYKFLAHAIY